MVKQLELEIRQLRVALKVIPDLYDGLGWHAPVHAIGGFPVMELQGRPIQDFEVAVKRTMDILVHDRAGIVRTVAGPARGSRVPRFTWARFLFFRAPGLQGTPLSVQEAPNNVGRRRLAERRTSPGKQP